MEFELIKEGEQGEGFFSYAREKARLRAETDPDVSDAVHFWDGSACKAAMVGDTAGGSWSEPVVDLAVLRFSLEDGMQWGQELDVKHSETKTKGTWHWPCGGQ